MAADGGIDWPVLCAAAKEAAGTAYAPYSHLRVGAAALTETDAVITGCNVENASYGLTLCAECGIVSALHRAQAGRLVALCVVDDNGDHLWPCGRCRQLLYEAGGPDLLIDAPNGPVRLEEILPFAFGAEHLPSPPTDSSAG